MKVKLTGRTLRRLMRRHKKTIASLAKQMGITQKRVRARRDEGLDSVHLALDWVEAITGWRWRGADVWNLPAVWEDVRRAVAESLNPATPVATATTYVSDWQLAI